MLPDLATALMLGQPLEGNAYLPIAGTAIGAIVFLGVTLWRFGREEF